MFRELAQGGRRRDQARARIRQRLLKTRGRVDQAAEALGVSSRTLSRWLSEHDLASFASKVRAKHHVPGPRP
jgi:DNA-binding NtrC family response regulator